MAISETIPVCALVLVAVHGRQVGRSPANSKFEYVRRQ